MLNKLLCYFKGHDSVFREYRTSFRHETKDAEVIQLNRYEQCPRCGHKEFVKTLREEVIERRDYYGERRNENDNLSTRYYLPLNSKVVRFDGGVHVIEYGANGEKPRPLEDFTGESASFQYGTSLVTAEEIYKKLGGK